MPRCGGGLYPRRMGGGRSMHAVIRDGLLATYRAKGYTAERGTVHFVRCEALARELAAAWRTNERLSYIRDPWRMDETMLARWERMLVLPRSSKDTLFSRRARLAAIPALEGQAVLYTLVSERAREAIGDRFIAVEHIPLASAVVHVPDGTYPFGTVDPSSPWSSNVAHCLVLAQKLPGDTEGSFFEAMGRLVAALDPILPAWMTFDWYREPDTGGTAVPDGPSEAGFYHDEPNLDLSVFDV